MIYGIAILSLLLTGCIPEFDHDVDSGRIGSGLTRRFLTQAEELGLSLSGSGGAFSGGIYALDLYLNKKGCYTLEEARLIYVTAVERFLRLINEDLEARPYFHSYPVTISSLEFMISFITPTGSEPQPPYISFVFADAGDLYYYMANSPSARHFERYHKARQWVWENFPEVLLKIYEGQ